MEKYDIDKEAIDLLRKVNASIDLDKSLYIGNRLYRLKEIQTFLIKYIGDKCASCGGEIKGDCHSKNYDCPPFYCSETCYGKENKI